MDGQDHPEQRHRLDPPISNALPGVPGRKPLHVRLRERACAPHLGVDISWAQKYAKRWPARLSLRPLGPSFTYFWRPRTVLIGMFVNIFTFAVHVSHRLLFSLFSILCKLGLLLSYCYLHLGYDTNSSFRLLSMTILL